MLSLDEARALIATRAHALAPGRVPLAEARGRVLRESAAAMEDMPAFDRSAWDGYAFRAADVPGKLHVAFEIAAGAVAERAILAGECARIFTGAALPAGADSVAMQEQCKRDGHAVEIPATPRGNGVRVRGEDARAGEVLLPRGTRLGAMELSLLAQLGYANPLVASRPRIAHIVTGAELVAPGAQPGAGQIRDSNSTLIAALADEAGCEIASQSRAGDDLPTLLAALAGAPDFDLLLISGGASVGDYDFGRAALTEMGFSIQFTALNLRPGKPLIFATRGRQLAFVIPGNPLSHFVCWHVAIRAALDVLTIGETALALDRVVLGGNETLHGNPRETWWPARLAPSGIATPCKWQSSGDLTGLAGVNALIRIPSSSAPLALGADVAILAV